MSIIIVLVHVRTALPNVIIELIIVIWTQYRTKRISRRNSTRICIVKPSCYFIAFNCTFFFRWEEIYGPVVQKLNKNSHFNEGDLVEFAVISADLIDGSKYSLSLLNPHVKMY